MIDIVAVSVGTISVELFSSVDLDFVEFFNEMLNESSCSLLENWDSFGFSLFFKVLLDLWEECLDVSHELTFAKSDLLETESINNINNAHGI